MRYQPFSILFFLMLTSFASMAQTRELPNTTVSLQNLEDFRPAAANWQLAGDVYYDLRKAGRGQIQQGTGVLVNELSARNKDNLFTKMEHGDIELELDFMMDKGSDAGIYLQGRYEVQLFDSWGVQNPTAADCGAIYERWDEDRPGDRKGYEGHPPAVNVSKAPGLWQHYKIVFRAPRFNAQGQKTANAVFVQVIHNGVTIHENVEVTGPTRAAAFQDEQPLGPLMIQGDHGRVAIRNISYKAFGTEPVTLTGLTLKAYEGEVNEVSAFDTQTPVKEMDIRALAHQGSGTRDKFGGKINGTLHIPHTGEYLFNLKLDWIPEDNNYPERPNGAGELVIGGKKAIVIDGEHGDATAMVQLEAGEHPVELSYLKKFGYWYAQSNDFTLSVEGSGVPYTTLNTPLRAAEPVGAIMVLAENEPVMLRSFIMHHGEKRTHTISVGEPGNANYTVDLGTGDFLQFWRGNFLETTPMWHERGEPQLGVPMGSVIELAGNPTLAFLSDANMAWPDSNTAYNYIGYEVDKNGRPSFKYDLGRASVREAFEVIEGGRKLAHSLAVIPGQQQEALWCRVAEGNEITKLPNGLYAINDKEYLIELPRRVRPIIRTTAENRKELLLPVKARRGIATAQYNIVW
ncbi:family 16 glycoside hydrolase [Pontibacter pamirensis]|uniref:family 16 glycoside hydrolase n=1 Tax=Pontibacter pamirensis TaxID=2562824 RepID=UPI001389ADE1|nr:family 16 glycoside hydrolase [Pontibacter pamirensis]